jgi:hypothetical protein
VNNYYRFYRAVWVERVMSLSTQELYEAITGNYYKTDDDDLFQAIHDLAYSELVKRGEIRARGSAPHRIKLVTQP